MPPLGGRYGTDQHGDIVDISGECCRIDPDYQGAGGYPEIGRTKSSQELLERLSAQRAAEARQLLDGLARFTPRTCDC